MTVTSVDLARANQRLRLHPHDYGAWLEVAALLGILGSTEDTELAFGTIGEGARIGGRVALAVACGRHLVELDSLRGSELIDHVVETYATGGPHFAFTAPPAPDDPPDVVPAGVHKDPIIEARALIDKLGAWLTARQVPTVPPAPLLSALSKPGARALIGVMTARAVPSGQVIIEIGEPATALYWIAHGTVTIARGEATLGELHSGAFFGEIALVGGTKRTARVTAQGDVWILEVPARALETAATKHPKLAEVLAHHARARLLANLTRTSELFRALDDEDREALLAKFATQMVEAGTTFIHEGTINEHLWVVVSGRCEVHAAGAALAELGPGAAVGEISLVSGALAVADVVAVEPAVLLRLSKHDFQVIAKKHPKLLEEVEKLVVARETANRALFQDASDLIV
ncbi:MAG: cyclic nucleotide-binding domain-containing protein [Deltaproteobacteria bacterium]|nr:cyclic nucleotide-binding domain-containing protein [Deltaproteobacteria bacterium]